MQSGLRKITAEQKPEMGDHGIEGREWRIEEERAKT
jgi:hypothetical protein